MAEPLYYEMPQPKWRIFPDADQELRTTLQLLHQRGVLRLLNNVLGALPEISQSLVEGVYNRPGGNAIQNITALIQLIGHVQPEEFRRLCNGLEHGLVAARETVEQRDANAPGLTGAVKMLGDEELWRSLQPALSAFKAFADALGQPTEQAPHPARPAEESV